MDDKEVFSSFNYEELGEAIMEHPDFRIHSVLDTRFLYPLTELRYLVDVNWLNKMKENEH